MQEFQVSQGQLYYDKKILYICMAHFPQLTVITIGSSMIANIFFKETLHMSMINDFINKLIID